MTAWLGECSFPMNPHVPYERNAVGGSRRGALPLSDPVRGYSPHPPRFPLFLNVAEHCDLSDHSDDKSDKALMAKRLTAHWPVLFLNMQFCWLPHACGTLLSFLNMQLSNLHACGTSFFSRLKAKSLRTRIFWPVTPDSGNLHFSLKRRETQTQS